MNKQKTIGKQRLRRRRHVRKRVQGDSERPRLTVYRSNQNMSCQIVDDATGRTLCSASTRDASLRDQVKDGGNCDAAKVIGQAIAARALEAGIKAVRFDRGSYKYHGRVAALADAAREAGLSL